MTLYQKFKRLKIDFSAIGLEQSDTKVTYFCTPKGAKIIGWAGVDGIHYCTIPEFGEMVFAVSPINFGDCVHPIARSFEDLLRLLLACGSMDAIEQAHFWDEEQFDEYVAENQPTPSALTVFDVLRRKLGVTPMEHPFAYIKELQASFDYSQFKYPPEYYDVNMNPAAEPEDAPEWRVTYDGGFWPRRGRTGKEVPVGKYFPWGNEAWYVPAVYACGAGLVMDFCMEVDPVRVREFIDKWDLLNEDKHRFTEEQREKIQDEHPLNMHFRAFAAVNGKPLREERSTCMTWIPESCLEDGEQTRQETKWLLEHYGLGLSRAWAIHRLSFRWATKRAPVIKSLSLRLERDLVSVPGIRFRNPKAEDEILFAHPVTGEVHTFTVREYRAHEMDAKHFRDESMEYPTHSITMVYSIWPEITDGFSLRDCGEGDHPRRKHTDPGSPVVAASVGIIGLYRREEGDPVYYHPDGTEAKPRAMFSNLHFAPVEDVEWRMVFQKKLMADIAVQLI